jgi:hypothetical protein
VLAPADAFRARTQALGLRETQDFHAEGIVDGVLVALFIDSSNIAVSASLRPVLDLGLEIANSAITGDEPARVVPLWGAEGPRS